MTYPVLQRYVSHLFVWPLVSGWLMVSFIIALAFDRCCWGVKYTRGSHKIAEIEAERHRVSHQRPSDGRLKVGRWLIG